MAIEILSAEAVLDNGRKNPEKSYPSPKRDAHRLVPFAEVATKPSFSFGTDAKVFTVGSCFARNIERSLRKMDYNVVSSSHDFYNPFPERQPFHRFNKYTIHSIKNELEWALGEREMNSAALMCPTKDDLYCDTQTLGDSLAAPLEEMVKFRETYNQTYATVAEADVVMMTLGLVECWHDEETGEYLNRFPGMTAIKNSPGRFTLHVLDYDEIYQGLVDTFELISRHNDSFKMLCTVSPVPLDRTFRQSDILVANAYSKSVQRAAVEAFVQTYPVDYFPSYEVVTLTDREHAWGDHDYRHVRGEMVDRLMGRVLERYTDVTERQSAQKTSGDITAYLAVGELDKAQKALEQHREKFGDSLELRMLASEIALRTGDTAEAEVQLRSFIAEVSSDPETAEALLQGPPATLTKVATTKLEQAQRMASSPNQSSPEQDKLRALSILDGLKAASPGDESLHWLRSYVERASEHRPTENRIDEKAQLLEGAGLARLRALSEGEVASAEEIVANAIKEIGVSEALHWELALIYRKADRLEAALELFAKIARGGGAKAVPAVKHALPLARRLKCHEMVADLAEDVAKTIG